MATAKLNVVFTVVVLAAAVALGGCESARKAFSGSKTAPDEFAVYSRPPLSLPPDYTLRPPEPGTDRPQRVSPSDVAKEAILGNAAAQTNSDQTVTSAGIQTLLRDTGGVAADPNIRVTINRETSILSEEGDEFINKMIFWVEDKPFQGTVVNAAEEQKRILQNQALGKPINEGEVPEIKGKRARKGLLDF
jgi:hypothetical protein